MSSQVQVNLPPVATKPLGALESSINSGQQSAPVAIVNGGRKVSVVWVTPIYNLRAVPTPGNSPKKK